MKKRISTVLSVVLLLQLGYLPCAAQKLGTQETGRLQERSFAAPGPRRGPRRETRQPRKKSSSPPTLQEVVPGTRVRIKAPSISKLPLVGTVVPAGADTLKVRLKWHAIPLAIPLASVTRLDVSIGQKRNAGKGALIGLLVGGVTGVWVWAVYGEKSASPSSGNFFSGGSWDYQFSCTIGGCAASLGGLGLVVGSVLGGILKTEKWQPVPLERVHVVITPQRKGGLALSALFAF